MQLQIDTGLKTYDILDADGNVTGTVRFNPADPGIAARWKSAEPEIQRLAWEKHGFRTDVSGTDSDNGQFRVDHIAPSITQVAAMPSYATMEKIMAALS